ncbi:MAG: VCBS repeat-containing protein [Myxococcota bacterium]
MRVDFFRPEITDVAFTHDIAFQQDGTGLAGGADWVTPINVTWSVVDNELIVTTLNAEGETEAVHRCSWLASTAVMDSVFCDVEVTGEPLRFEYVRAGAIRDPLFQLTSSFLSTGLTEYWQSTFFWRTLRVSEPEEVDPTGRFGFLFDDAGAIRQMRFRESADSPTTLEPGLPTLSIDPEFQFAEAGGVAELAQDWDAVASVPGCFDPQAPGCVPYRKRFWSPVADRGGFIVVVEHESFAEFRPFFEFYNSTDMTFERVTGETFELSSERSNRTWPRINAYYREPLPMWPWISSALDFGCGTAEVVDGRYNSFNECTPRLLDEPLLSDVEDSPRSVVAVDFDGNGRDEAIVSFRTSIKSFEADDNGNFVETGSIEQPCCGSRSEAMLTDSTNSGVPEVSFLYLGDSPRLVSCVAGLTCTSVALPPGASDGVQTRAVASFQRFYGSNSVVVVADGRGVLLNASPTGFVIAPDDLEVGGNPESVGAGDLDNDGIDDVVISVDSDRVLFFFGNESGQLVQDTSLVSPVSDLVSWIAIEDFGNDGNNELLIQSFRGMLYYPLFIRGLGFTVPVLVESFGQANIVGDLDSDSNLDVLNADFTAELITGTSNGLDGAVVRNPRGRGSVIDGTVGRFDGDANADVVLLKGPFDPESASDLTGALELLSGSGL